MWLKFSDPFLEEAFLAREYSERRNAIRANALITLLVLIGFSLLDPLLVPASLLAKYYFVRLGILVPFVILTFVGTFYIHKPSMWIPFVAPLLLFFGLSWSWLLQWQSDQVVGYLSLGLIQTTVGTLFLLGLPVRVSIPVVCVFCGTFVVYAIQLPIELGKTLTHTAGCITVAVISGVGAVRSERASRQQLVSNRISEAQSKERLAVEADRNKWLKAFAGFLRHEMKNAINGVSTSIELAIGEMAPGQAVEYMERGQDRLGYMRRLLNRVADATDLETAIAVPELKPVDLSALVRARADDLRRAAPDWVIDARIAPDISVIADEDSLNQMLDKLLDNAFEHGDCRYPLTIELIRNERQASLIISDRGDIVPCDSEEIFKPFTTTKKLSRSATDHLGLGLFVARTIALRHGGSIAVTSLHDPPGASFIVSLPVMSDVSRL